MRYLYPLLGLLLCGSISATAQQVQNTKVNSTESCSDLSVHGKLVDLNKELEAKKYSMTFFQFREYSFKNPDECTLGM